MTVKFLLVYLISIPVEQPKRLLNLDIEMLIEASISNTFNLQHKEIYIT